jgi:hypothetical protein
MEHATVDTTLVKVHRHGQATGQLKGGMTTKTLPTKIDPSFSGMIHITAPLINARRLSTDPHSGAGIVAPRAGAWHSGDLHTERACAIDPHIQ